MKAVYYPHTSIKTEPLLRTGLVMWDTIECITPQEKWAHYRFSRKPLNEAVDLLVRSHEPTPDERSRTRDRIQKFIDAYGVPRLFLSNRDPRTNPYLIHPRKLDEFTWRYLRERRLAEWNRRENDYELSQGFGLIVMSFLAQECAGRYKERITDRTTAYAWVTEQTAKELGGAYLSGADAKHVSQDVDRLLAVSVEVLDVDQIPLERLLTFRQKELKERNGGDYRKLRHNYANVVHRYLKQLQTEGKSDTDYRALVDRFREEMSQSLAD
jgi:hypothetical protein